MFAAAFSSAAISFGSQALYASSSTLRLDNVRRLAVKPLGVLHDRIPAALLYVRHHTADNLLNIAARTSRTGLHFADNGLLCRAVRLYYI